MLNFTTPRDITDIEEEKIDSLPTRHQWKAGLIFYDISWENECTWWSYRVHQNTFRDTAIVVEITVNSDTKQ